MISEVDDNMSGSIDFGEFLKVIENQKERAENFDDENYEKPLHICAVEKDIKKGKTTVDSGAAKSVRTRG